MMTILEDLLEFEKPLSEGVRLTEPSLKKKSFWDRFRRERLVERCHYKYHRTKAGLYAVLEHNEDGSLYVSDVPVGGSENSELSISPFQKIMSDDFSLPLFSAVTYSHTQEGVYIKSCIKHDSGVNIEHIIDSNGVITSLGLKCYLSMVFSRAPPIWSFEVDRESQGAQVRGEVRNVERYAFSSDGRVDKVQGISSLEGKTIDYEKTLGFILGLIHEFHNSEAVYQGLLQSPDVLVFK